MFTRRYSLIALAILLALSAAKAVAQSTDGKAVAETFTAKTANLPGRASQPVSLEILRWSTDDERSAALAVIKKGGAAEAFAAAVSGLPTVGYLWAGTPLGYAVKYAQRISDPSGTERIILVTDRPFGTWDLPSAEAARSPAPAPAAAAPAAAPDAGADPAAAPAGGAGRGGGRGAAAGGGRGGGRGAAAGAVPPAAAADADPAAAPAAGNRQGGGAGAAAGGGRGGARGGGRGGAPAAASVPVEQVLTVVELRLPGKGPGAGKLSLTGKLAMDDQAKTLGIADYDAAATVLTNVVRGPKAY